MRFSKSLAFLLAFVLPAAATRDDPNLRIQEDNPVGKPMGGGPPTIFSSKLTWKDDKKDVWKDVMEENEDKLSQLAKDAWWQMNKYWVANDIPLNRKPYVMTVLPVGHEVYMFSSMKTGAFVLWAKDESNPVYQALNQCQVAFREIHEQNRPAGASRLTWDLHRNKAGCGEVMAIYAYFQDHEDEAEKFRKGEKTALDGAHIATVRNLNYDLMRADGKALDNDEGYDAIVRYDPCGTDRREDPKPFDYGCFQFTKKFGLIAVEEGQNGVDQKKFSPLDIKGDDITISQTPLRCKPPTP